MRKLLARILCSAADAMWQKNPTLGHYTSKTYQHELNLAFHFAAELKDWFPWLDCDFDVSKTNLKRKRPDIILHRRGCHALNFLVIEVKREKSRRDVLSDLKKIRRYWFGSKLKYSYGAAVIMEDDKPQFEAQVLRRAAPKKAPEIFKSADLRDPLRHPSLAPACWKALSEKVDRIVKARKEHPGSATLNTLEIDFENSISELYRLSSG